MYFPLNPALPYVVNTVWGGGCYTPQCSGQIPSSSSCCNGRNKHRRARKCNKLEGLPGWLCMMGAPFNRVGPRSADGGSCQGSGRIRWARSLPVVLCRLEVRGVPKTLFSEFKKFQDQLNYELDPGKRHAESLHLTVGSGLNLGNSWKKHCIFIVQLEE